MTVLRIAQNVMLKNKITVDADILIWYLRGDDTVAAEVEEYLANDIQLAASMVVVLEVLRGMRPNERMATEALLESIEQISIDAAVTQAAFELFKSERRRGHTLPFADSIIAATAVVAEAPLLTANKKDFPAHILV